jgi:hypothetical protein
LLVVAFATGESAQLLDQLAFGRSIGRGAEMMPRYRRRPSALGRTERAAARDFAAVL